VVLIDEVIDIVFRDGALGESTVHNLKNSIFTMVPIITRQGRTPKQGNEEEGLHSPGIHDEG
jgi:hypothetical protein